MDTTYKVCAVTLLLTASNAAMAQPSCGQQVRQLEQRIEQRQMDQQLQTQLEQLLRAAEQNPGDCQTYLARAEEVMAKRSSAQTAQASQASASQPQKQGQSAVEKASQLMGQTVNDQQGQELGKLDDFALNLEDGKLAYAVISTGGMLNKKKVGVPVKKLQPASQGEGFVTSISKKDIESAQSLPQEQWPAQPALGGQAGGGGTAEAASKLMGQTVRDGQGNNLGTIEDFAVNMQENELAYVVLGAGGGMLGLGDQKLIGIPSAALQQAQDGYVASISQREVEQASDLPEQNWPSEPTITSAGKPQGAGGVKQSTRIQGQTVTNRQGEILGQVEGFALDMQQGKLAYVAIMTEQGKQVGIPADMLEQAPQGEGYVADISLQELQSAKELPRQNWPEQPSIASSGKSSTQPSKKTGGANEFSSLDQNQDGRISRQEAQQGSQQLSQNFQQLDRDSDQKLDRTEFAAFEQQKQ